MIEEDRKIKKMISQTASDERIPNYFIGEMIVWNFNPSISTDFGGFWKAVIKQMKNHLKRNIGAQILAYEEFLTLVAQISHACEFNILLWLCPLIQMIRLL